MTDQREAIAQALYDAWATTAKPGDEVNIGRLVDAMEQLVEAAEQRGYKRGAEDCGEVAVSEIREAEQRGYERCLREGVARWKCASCGARWSDEAPTDEGGAMTHTCECGGLVESSDRDETDA